MTTLSLTLPANLGVGGGSASQPPAGLCCLVGYRQRDQSEATTSPDRKLYQHSGFNIVVAMIVKTISFITDPTVAEVMVVWQAIQFCWELGFQRAIFEGDSLIVISALRQVFTCWQGFEQLLDDTRLSLIVFFLKMCGIFEETPTKRLIEWPR
jgi:hypothetical protein